MLGATVDVDVSGSINSEGELKAKIRFGVARIEKEIEFDLWGGRTQLQDPRSLPPNQPPTAVITQSAPSVFAGDLYSGLSAESSTDPEERELMHQWDLDADGIFGETGANALRGNETGVNPSVLFARHEAGQHTVRLLVRDIDNLTHAVSRSVTVLPPPPRVTLQGSDVLIEGDAGKEYSIRLNTRSFTRLDNEPIVVDSVSDVSDANVGVGQLSLREAITIAQLSKERNPSATYTVTLSPNIPLFPVTAVRGQIRIRESISLVGSGWGTHKISAQGETRLFNVAPDVTFTIDGVTLQNGYAGATDFSGEVGGGAIYNKGRLVVRNSRFDSNRSYSHGGAIYSVGRLRIENSRLDFNSAGAAAATGNGGAIYLSPEGANENTIENSLIKQNSADSGGGIAAHRGVRIVKTTIHTNSAKDGGGLWANAFVDLRATTLSTNTASHNGGGAYVTGDAYAIIENVTVSDNHAELHGGGINHADGTILLINSTLVHNTVDGLGAGLAIQSEAQNATINNTIIAQNLDLYPTYNFAFRQPTDHSDIQGFVTRGKGNLIGAPFGLSGLNGVDNKIGTNTQPLAPRLGPLQNNGGMTFTHAPLLGSPAIDSGVSIFDIAESTTDQAGQPRIKDLAGVTNRTGSPGVDIGAFEVQPGITWPTPDLDTSENGDVAVFEVSLNVAPESDVVIEYTSLDPSEARTSSRLLFTPKDWDIPQIVTVTGVDDKVADGDQNYLIQVRITTEDPFYQAVMMKDIILVNRDNDVVKTLPMRPAITGPATIVRGQMGNLVVESSVADANAAQLYVFDIDWGDGTTPEFVAVDSKQSPQVSLQHVYEETGNFRFFAKGWGEDG